MPRSESDRHGLEHRAGVPDRNILADSDHAPPADLFSLGMNVNSWTTTDIAVNWFRDLSAKSESSPRGPQVRQGKFPIVT
eukprot:5767130-Pyramimonas_sp.AAC.1